MKILQSPITPNHKSAMFFDGVIAESNSSRGNFKLETYQDGEICLEDVNYIGKDIVLLGIDGLINDNDLDDDFSWNSVDILVDKFIAITVNGMIIHDDESNIFDNYDEAITAFKIMVGE